jgi:hypothetical protein
VLIFRSFLGLPVLALCLAAHAQVRSDDTNPDAPILTQQEKAAQQVKQQEQQRIAGVVPNFNASYNEDAPPLSPKQKLHIAFHTAIDPVSFVIADSTPV